MTPDPENDSGMWCAVLNQALVDALDGLGVPKRPTRSSITEAERAAAAHIRIELDRQYFSMDNPDYLNICAMAGVDPQAVCDRAWDMFAALPVAEAVKSLVPRGLVLDVPYIHLVPDLRQRVKEALAESESETET